MLQDFGKFNSRPEYLRSRDIPYLEPIATTSQQRLCYFAIALFRILSY